MCIKIKETLTAEIINFYRQGVRTFWIGGSIGVDTWADEIITELKKQDERIVTSEEESEKAYWIRNE